MKKQFEKLFNKIEDIKKDAEHVEESVSNSLHKLIHKDDIENDHKHNFADYLKAAFKHDPGKEGKSESFFHIFQEFKEMLEKPIYEVIVDKQTENLIKGDYWVNWGQTLITKCKYFFSDGSEKPAGYLVYKDGKLLVEDKEGNPVHVEDVHKQRDYLSPTKLEHLLAIVQLAHETQSVIKCFGTSHSWAPIHATDGILVDNRRINENNYSINPADPLTDHADIAPAKGKLLPTVTSPPGAGVGKMEQYMWNHSPPYSLGHATIEDVFTVGGLISTSSHGTGRFNTVLSDLVVALTLVTFHDGKPQVVKITANDCPEWLLKNSKGEKDLKPVDIWRTAQVGLGALGIIWDATLVIEPKIETHFVTETAKWEEYFADTKEARDKLAKLQSEWDTLEFWYYPLTFNDKKASDLKISDLLTGKVTINPYIFIWKTKREAPQGYKVEDKNVEDFYQLFIGQSFAAKYAGKMMTWVETHKLARGLIPRVTAFTTYGVKDMFGNEATKTAFKIPQWLANHPVPAVSVVEPVKVLDIEWAVPINYKDGEGLKDATHIYRHLIQSVQKKFHQNEYPVTINVEMRFMKGSGAPMSPEYLPHLALHGSENDKGDTRGFAAPEIVSHSPNSHWEKFYAEMHNDFESNSKLYGHIKNHQAKQFCSLRGSLSFLRNAYDSPTLSPWNHPTYNTAFKLWREVRDRFDPNHLFRSPYINQFFYTTENHFIPPNNFQIQEGGGIKPNFK